MTTSAPSTGTDGSPASQLTNSARTLYRCPELADMSEAAIGARPERLQLDDDSDADVCEAALAMPRTVTFTRVG